MKQEDFMKNNLNDLKGSGQKNPPESNRLGEALIRYVYGFRHPLLGTSTAQIDQISAQPEVCTNMSELLKLTREKEENEAKLPVSARELDALKAARETFTNDIVRLRRLVNRALLSLEGRK